MENLDEHFLSLESIVEHVRGILKHLPDDEEREGLQRTPERIAEAYVELFKGYRQSVPDLFTCFEENGYDEMVLVKDIPFYSLCEHHMLPFLGVVHVGYIPKEGRCVGLSKIPRLVEVFARRLQMQERLTSQIVDTLDEHLLPLGAICVVEAEHFCVTMRGVRAPGSKTTTSKVSGVFKDNPETRAEAMALIHG